MQTNTLADTIEYIKDLTGQSNASTSKIVRAVNYAVDHYTYLALTSSGRWKWDSTNQTDVPRLTTTISSGVVELESDTITIQQAEILENGKYQLLQPIDIRDNQRQPISEENSGTGVPRYYDLNGRLLYVFPAPDTARTLRLTVGRAHPRFDPTDTSVALGVPPIHEEYIALYAADRLMIGSSDSARTAIRNELTVKQEEIKDLFSKRDQDTGRRIKGSIPSVFMHRARGKRY